MHSASWTSRAAACAVALSLAAAGCAGGAPPPIGAARLAVSAPPPGVASVVVTIGAADLSPLSEPLVSDGAGFAALVTGIPAGPARRFDAIAYDAAGTPLFQGSATSDIVADAVADVPILLEGVPPSGFVDAAPVIDVLWTAASSVAAGGTVSAGVTAHDPDPADTIAYDWTASCGTFDVPAASTVTWTAPSVGGGCDVFVTVSDGRGASVTASVHVDVL